MSPLFEDIRDEYLRRRAEYDANPTEYVRTHRDTRYQEFDLDTAHAVPDFIAGDWIDYPNGDAWDLDDYADVIARRL